MKIIDGKGSRMGRLASYVAKGALKGEEFAVLNCNDVIISGNREMIKQRFQDTKGKIGSGQKGPKVSKNPHMIVKRAIRGMIPNHRRGRGKIAFSKIKCYPGIPKEFEEKKMISSEKGFKGKHVKVSEMLK